MMTMFRQTKKYPKKMMTVHVNLTVHKIPKKSRGELRFRV